MIEIKDKSKCCGCGACANICPHNCIEMKPDKEGFLHPQVDREACIRCGLCIRACQYLQEKKIKQTYAQPQVYAVQSKNARRCAGSTSGGFCQTLTEYVIQNGGVVFGAGYDENMKVRHTCAQTLAECMAFQKSKYVQSEIGDSYKEAARFLKKGTTVLFTGTPCQIGGLYQFLNKDYEHLITVDVVCYGVPSPRIFADYVASIQDKNADVLTQIDLRDKSRGWGEFYVSHSFADTAKNAVFPSYKDEYFTLFLSHMATRQSCHNCLYTHLQRYSDFTAGDYWGVENFPPPLVKSRGISKILINSDKGKAIWQQISDAFLAVQMPLETAVRPNLKAPPQKSPKRDAFYRDYVQNGYDYAMKRYVRKPFYKKAYYSLKRSAARLLKR